MCLAIPGRIETIDDGQDEALRQAKVSFGGIKRDVCLALTPEAAVGDYVLVHVGFAIGVIDEAEAQRIFETLDEMESP
jgi:hydrogenase expression/formation protein HypC